MAKYSGLLFVDTDDENIDRNLDQTFSFNKKFNTFTLDKNNNDLLNKQVGKFGVIAFGIELDLGNINDRNSVIQFYSSNTGGIEGTLHTVNLLTISAGRTLNYISQADLRTDILAIMNSLTGSTGLTFSFSPVVWNPNLFNLNSAGGSFCFALQSSDSSIITNKALINGKYTYNFSREQILKTTHICGGFLGMYTRYIDVVAPEMTDDITISSVDSKNKQNSNIVTRFYLTTEQAYEPYFNYFVSVQNPNFIKKDPSRSIREINFKLIDEFGEELILENNDDATESNSFFSIIFQLF